MSTPEKRPTVTVTGRISIADIDQDGLSQADDEEIISAFTEEYEKRLRNLLTNVDLHFEWKRAQGEKPKVHCNCWRLGPDCEHEEDVKETLSLETPWLDAVSAALSSVEPGRWTSGMHPSRGSSGNTWDGGRRREENTRAAGS